MTIPGMLLFVSEIEPSIENAKAIQALVLQDLRSAKDPEPRLAADPDNESLVVAQLKKLEVSPECYCGFTRDGELVAFMKHKQWLEGDELPFATGLRSFWLRCKRFLPLSRLTGQWGIFGLVADKKLSMPDRMEALCRLLRYSIDVSGVTVNIPLHAGDRDFRPFVESYGFAIVGKKGRAVGAEGFLQHRYQRQASRT